MAPRPASRHAARWLMALLWLLASLAYLTREQTVPVGPGALSVGQLSGVVFLTAPGDHSETMEMPGEAAPASAPEHPGSAADQPGHCHWTHHAGAPPPPTGQHHHAGHCPFCFTAAFALEAGVVAVALPLPGSLPVRRALHLAVLPGSVADHHARAPPVPA